jgi:hypothetical protein
MKKNLDHSEPIQGLRFNVFDIIDRNRKASLKTRDNSLGHILSRKPVVSKNYAYDRNVDAGENVSRGRIDRQRP